MIGLVRAATLCATLAFGLVAAQAARQGLQARRSRRFRDQAGGPDQERGGSGRQVGGEPANRCRRRLQAQRFPHRPANPRANRRHHAGGQRQLAAAGPHHLPDQPGQHQRADLPAGTRLDRGLYRLSACRQCRRRGRCAGRARPGDVRAQAVASGARCAAAVARSARGRRCARPIRENARRARLPAARLYRRFRFGLAARLLPVLRGPRQAHRFYAVPGAGGQRQAGAVVGRQSSFASMASSMASATTSICAPACRPRSRKACRNRPNSTSMCATASRSCASPGAPMCCRAPASAAFRWSASTRRR